MANQRRMASKTGTETGHAGVPRKGSALRGIDLRPVWT